MAKFIKNNFKTIMFILFIGLIVGGIFLYRYIDLRNLEYTPDNGPKEYDINKYEDNQYSVINMNATDVYNMYYKDYLKLLVNNPTVAYSKLTDDCKRIEFNNDYKAFLKFIKNIDKKIVSTGKITRYRVDNNVINIIDNYDNGYSIYEDGVWNYTVYLRGVME